MARWFERDYPTGMVVHFPAAGPPAAEAFGRLRSSGIDVRAVGPGETLWRLALEHPDWGRATLSCVREPVSPTPAIAYVPWLTRSERTAAEAATSAVVVTTETRRGHVLRDRKTLLRWAGTVMGEDGVIAVDVTSQLPWTRQSLDDELAHDADVDVEALYTIHLVYEGDRLDRSRTAWIHTHGLAEVGGIDIDILEPHPDFASQCGEPIRAIALQGLEGKISVGGPAFAFAHPDGNARLVDVKEFMASADQRHRAIRDADGHGGVRAVACEPAEGGFMSRIRRPPPEPMAFARRPVPDHALMWLSDGYSALAARRAAGTLGLFASLREEFAPLGLKALVKLGYPTPSGGREHLWFEVHDIGADWVDATLINDPYEVDLKAGERARRDLSLLSDWLILTPAGSLSPRSTSAARVLRERAS